MMFRKVSAAILFFCQLLPGDLHSQESSGIEMILNEASRVRQIGLNNHSLVNEFYRRRSYRAAWTNTTDRSSLLTLLARAPDFGLRKSDYHPAMIGFLEKSTSSAFPDTLEMELRLSDAAIHFFSDLVYGDRPPNLSYNGLSYQPSCLDIPALIGAALLQHQLELLPAVVEQKLPEYVNLKKHIIHFNSVLADPTFSESKISSSVVSSSNLNLVKRLWQLGVIDSIDRKWEAKELVDKLKLAQKLFSLQADGLLKKATLDALNVPMSARLDALNKAINTLRWLYCIRQNHTVVVVNLPSASLLVYDNYAPVLESRVIVGKISTPTPTLAGRITDVVLYPYWMVPNSIATKELLPAIKRNPGYLSAGNYQVLNKEGRVVNPYAVNWHSLSGANFPYVIRQSTGCDNALGLVKLNFYNPFGVYLHDTPGKSLFSRERRFFSHGCMRVQKAMELAKLALMKHTRAIDTLTAKGCLYHRSPLIVPADKIMPVFVLYQTAWVDSAGDIRFYEDVYRRN